MTGCTEWAPSASMREFRVEPHGRPHSHSFSDRMVQPGDMIFLDIIDSFDGYRTCTSALIFVERQHQIDAYETASNWISASIDMVRPVTPDEVAFVWADAQEFGFRDEAEAFLLQYGHGVGLSLSERPIFSRGASAARQAARGGHDLSLETSKGADDGSPPRGSRKRLS